MPFLIILLGLTLILGLFYGCRKDNSVNDYSEVFFTPSEEYKSLIEEAKIYCENRLEILKNANIGLKKPKN